MNKFLLTTALVASFVTSDASAKLDTSISGSIDTKFANIYQKEKFRYRNLSNSTKEKLTNNNIATDTYLNVNVESKIDNGVMYGSFIKLNANTSNSKKEMFSHDNEKSSVAEQVMAYIETDYGRVEIGNYTGVTEAMKVNTEAFASATGGISGDSQYYWNTNVMERNSNKKIKTRNTFLQTGNLPTNELGTFGIKSTNAAKINYYSPEFSGFKFGATFVPNDQVYGSTSKTTTIIKDENGFKNIFETSLSYTSEINDVGLKVAAVGEFAKNQNNDKTNLKAYEIGGHLSYQGVTLGASYGDWGKYDIKKSDSNKYGKTNYWTAGVGYANGPFSASITHLQSKKGDAGTSEQVFNKLKNTVLGVDYKITSGVSPYVEFSSFKMIQALQVDTNNNKGHALMTGIKLNF